jgi:4-amino-4-deoxy-L-arabinose transferase-like glycosyltransferase
MPVSKSRRFWLVAMLLLGVVLVAFVLRYLRTTIGLPYLYHYDEPQTASAALRMLKTGDFNPHFFSYGTLMIYLNLLVDKIHYVYLTTQASALAGPGEIQINSDTGWHWTISHPSFYYWNRMLTAVLGTATVFMTYLVGKSLFNRWVGLAASAFLATLPIHIEHSAKITPDVPVAFFVLSATWLSLRFIETRRTLWLTGSLVVAGLAIATKYNSGIVLLLLFASLSWARFSNREAVQWHHWALLLAIPPLTFVLAMPYAILDLPSFMRDVLHEIYHYKVLGHGKHTSVPGWDHFSSQIVLFHRSIGLAASILACVGLVSIAFRPRVAIAMSMPILYVLYMSSMKVNFHRNFILVYPFIALLFGAGLFCLYRALRRANMSPSLLGVSPPLALVTVVALLVLSMQAHTALIGSRRSHAASDTRVRVVDVLNSAQALDHVVISKELRIHPQDLSRIRAPYTILPLERMLGRESPPGTLYLLPARVRGGREDVVRNKQAIIDSIPPKAVHYELRNRSATYLNRFSCNPDLLVVRQLSDVQLDPSAISLDAFTVSSGDFKYNGTELRFERGRIESAPIRLDPGEHAIEFMARKPATLKSRKANVTLLGYRLNVEREKSYRLNGATGLRVSVRRDGERIASRVFNPGTEFEQYMLPFTLRESGILSVEAEFVSDHVEGTLPPLMDVKMFGVSSVPMVDQSNGNGRTNRLR